MLSKHLFLATMVAYAKAEYWIFGGLRPIVTTRLDPVINPNTIGSHVHAVVGASRFKNVYDLDDLLQSNCTTVPVQPDKSNYWAPQMYYQDQASGQFTPMPTSFNIYYLLRPGPKNESIKAFPPGLRMIAGNPNRRTYNASSFADQAITFVCLDLSGAHASDPDWAERPNFFDHNCPDGMRAQVFFPTCWDGVNLDSPDHTSHMAYPIQNFNSGDCPETHPVHLVSLFYEMFVSVDKFPYWGPGTWVFASGDTTGYGHHGDFQNGWDVDLLQEALDTCVNANGNVMDCPTLAAVFDQASADACVLETDIVDEAIGFNGPISSLTGCNPLWNGTTPKPPCPANVTTPALIPAQIPLPANWSEVGCIAEGTDGRAFVAASTTSPNMTRAMCATFCQDKGFPLAGVEFSDECYCDDEFRNGASNATVLWNECTNHCAGNSNEICGGPMRLTLLVSSNPPQVPTDNVPAGWTPLGCVSDNAARALTGYSFTSDNMTVASCVTTCAAQGSSLAGIEYASECYCGSSFQNGVGTPIDPATCNMVCSGDDSSTCGGSWALTAFASNTNATETTTTNVQPSSTSSVQSSASETVTSSDDSPTSSPATVTETQTETVSSSDDSPTSSPAMVTEPVGRRAFAIRGHA